MNAELRIHIHPQVNVIWHDFELDQLCIASFAHARDDLLQPLSAQIIAKSESR